MNSEILNDYSTCNTNGCNEIVAQNKNETEDLSKEMHTYTTAGVSETWDLKHEMKENDAVQKKEAHHIDLEFDAVNLNIDAEITNETLDETKLETNENATVNMMLLAQK